MAAINRYLSLVAQRWGVPRRMSRQPVLLVAAGGLLMLFALATLVFRVGGPPAPAIAHVPYSVFLAQVSAGNVKTATIDVATQDISGTLRHPITYAQQTASRYATTVYPLKDDITFRRMLTNHGVTLVPPRADPLVSRLASLGLFLLGVCGVALLRLGARLVHRKLPGVSSAAS